MRTDFAPSVNIVRDREKHFDYVLTPNSRSVFDKIVAEYKVGFRAFNIIGSYGTGKSTFLWAFEKNLTNKATYFGKLNGQFNHVKQFKFINIVAEYESILSAFGKQVASRKVTYLPSKILEKLDAYYKNVSTKNEGLVIVIDEFGKFLEYAANHETEKELYFVQQLAEYCNDTRKNIILLTSLHQGFDSYSRSLDYHQRQEWEKVRGRLIDLPFNEEEEHLLYIASRRLERKARGTNNSLRVLTDAIARTGAFPVRTYPSTSLAEKVFPFDLLSVAVLSKALQRYGQNERSLFTFLESRDVYGLHGYEKSANPYYNLSCVYDYLIYNHFTFLSTRDNPHYLQWAAIKSAIERVEGELENYRLDANKLVKTIGLLNIFSREGGKIDEEFLNVYGKHALGISEVNKILRFLENKKIVRYVQFKKRYILFEGTDFDFESALADASKKIDAPTDIVSSLKRYFEFPVLSSKAYHFKKGTPRFFVFRISEEPVLDPPSGEIDGIINLIFSERVNRDSLKETSKRFDGAVLYALYLNSREIKNVLWEIEKIEYVMEGIAEDRVARRELFNLHGNYVEQLNKLVLEGLFQPSRVLWVFQGKEKEIHNQRLLNDLLTKITESVYAHTPTLKNELINRHKLPATISIARKKLLEALTTSWDKEDLGFPQAIYPPEKAIYESLLKRTGIHRRKKGVFTLTKPTDKTFHPIWQACEQFLKSARVNRKNLADLFDLLQTKPFKLKHGLIDFWVPIYLFIRREDYALFGEQGYIPNITQDVLDLVLKNPNRFELKTFDVSGIRLELFNRYRSFINKETSVKVGSSTFIDTIRPFLTFYKGLPEYTKRTKRLSSDTLTFRDVIATAQDPEKAFFDDFPEALGYLLQDLQQSDAMLEKYIKRLQQCVRELRSCFDELINRIEEHLLEEFGYGGSKFPVYREHLHGRYVGLKDFLLLPHQRSFCNRLLSPLDDRKAWLSAVGQAALGKPIDLMSDEEEFILHAKISDLIKELDNLSEVSEAKGTENNEEIIRLEITTQNRGMKRLLIRVPANKKKSSGEIEKEIRKVLSKDWKVNAISLSKLLEEQLKNE